ETPPQARAGDSDRPLSADTASIPEDGTATHRASSSAARAQPQETERRKERDGEIDPASAGIGRRNKTTGLTGGENYIGATQDSLKSYDQVTTKIVKHPHGRALPKLR
ncbi:MAG: hypothetical protein HY056_00515, partial [Proteobacteria bacterium]|nr:hypothetical protein [Pseudomonadota bacterium]